MIGLKKIILATLIAAILSGCFFGFGTGLVNGTILVDGSPMGGFEVTFSSTKNKDLVIRGVAIEDGTFRLTRGRGKLNIPTGEYRVSLSPIAIGEKTPAPKIALPQKYTDTNQAVITKTIRTGKNEIKIEVETGK